MSCIVRLGRHPPPSPWESPRRVPRDGPTDPLSPSASCAHLRRPATKTKTKITPANLLRRSAHITVRRKSREEKVYNVLKNIAYRGFISNFITKVWVRQPRLSPWLEQDQHQPRLKAVLHEGWQEQRRRRFCLRNRISIEVEPCGETKLAGLAHECHLQERVEEVHVRR